MDWARHYLPFLRWLPRYDVRKQLVGDLIAALTVTAVAAPEAVSYAGIAGLPAAQGLNTGFLAPLAYAAAGASPQLIVGPTAIMCILTNNAIPTAWGGSPVEAPGEKDIPALRVQLAAALAAAVALLQLAMGLLRLGGLVSLISTPVVAGFTTGSALLTASSQVSSLLGLPKCVGAGGGSCNVGEAAAYVANNWRVVPWRVPLLSLACVVLLLVVKYAPPRLSSHPAARIVGNLAPLVLVAVAVPITSAYGSTLEAWGMEPPKAIPPGVPSPSFPFTALDRPGSSADWVGLFGAAVPLAVIGYMGAVTITQTVARQYGPYATDSAQELWGQVAANAACAIGSGLPVTGSFSRTAVNAASGARSALASALTGGFMALSLATITHVLQLVPSVARSAIVVVAIAKMVELHLLPSLWRADRLDCAVFAVTVLTVCFWNAAPGLAVGVAFSWLLALTRHAALPTPISVHGWAKEGSGGGGYGGAAAMPPLPPVSSFTATTGGAGSSSADAAVAEALAAVRAAHAWQAVPPPAEGGDSDDASSSAPAHYGSGDTSATRHGTACVELHVSPDLQFHSGERLAERIAEAAGVCAPAVVLLDCGGVASADTTGARAALGAAQDACLQHGLVPVVVHSAPPGVRGVLARTAAITSNATPLLQQPWKPRAEQRRRGKATQRGDDAGAAAPAAPGLDALVARALVAAVEAGDLVEAGSVFLAATPEAALRVAQDVCALRLLEAAAAAGGAPSGADAATAGAAARLSALSAALPPPPPQLAKGKNIRADDVGGSGKGDAETGGAAAEGYAPLLLRGGDDELAAAASAADESKKASSGGDTGTPRVEGVPLSPVALARRSRREARTREALLAAAAAASSAGDGGAGAAAGPSALSELSDLLGLDATRPRLSRRVA